MQDQDFIKIFFKSISSDGQTITIEDMRRMLKELNLDEGKAEEYIERTAGMSKAKSFTLEQMTEVIRGKMMPQSYTQKKQRELEMQKQKEMIQKQEQMELQQRDELIGEREKKKKRSEKSGGSKNSKRSRRSRSKNRDASEEMKNDQ